MAQISTLPVISVGLGVGRTSWTDSTGQTLIDITSDVKDFRTMSGKQHELDRFETGQITLTLDNRIGPYTPFDTTTQTYKKVGGGTTSAYSPHDLAQTMNWLVITATWSGTTYTVFSGFVTVWQLVTPDEVNSEINLSAEDPMKMLSTTRLLNDTLYTNAVTEQNRYLSPTLTLTRCGDTKINAGPLVTDGPAPSVLGNANPGQPGPFVYDNTTAIDLSNGTQAGTGSLIYPDLNPPNNANTEFYIEAWIKGAQTGDFLLANYRPSNYQITGVGVDGDGHVRLQRRTLTSGSPTDATLDAPRSGAKVSDGAWHLVGLQWHSNTWTIFVDGQVVSTYADSTARLRILSVGAWIGGTTSLPIGSYGTTATVANIAVSGLFSFAITENQPYVHDRYRIGSLLSTNTYQAKATAVSGTGSVATITARGFVTGQTVTLSGFSASGLNGTYTITAHTATTFSISSTVTSSTTLGIVTLPYKTTGYRVLEALQVANVVPTISGSGNGAPALTNTSGTGLYWNIETGTAFTGAEVGTAYNKAASEVCLQASDTELGAFFWATHLSSFVFHDRFWWARSNAAGAVATISDQNGNVARYLSDLELIQDDLDLWTETQITAVDGSTSNLTSANVGKYGPRTYTRTTDADSQLTIDAISNTILYRHQQPNLRVSRATLSSAGPSVNMTTMLSVMLGDVITFQRRDAASLALTTNLVVESKAHDFRADPGEWRTTYAFSPFEIYGSPYMTIGTTTINSSGFFANPFGG